MDNPYSLTGRRMLVTGAGQGIGRRVAEMAVSLGAKVGVLDISGDNVNSLAAELGADNAKAYVGTVTDQAFIDDVIADMTKDHGGVDSLFNNAGIVRASMIHKMTREQWDEVIGVNLTGVFLCLQSMGRHMIARSEGGEGGTCNGQIVNVSSTAGLRGTIGQINYGAAKSGVLGITMSAAREWARYGISVNAVAFGTVVTPMTEVIRGPKFGANTLSNIPLGRFAETDDVAPGVCFLMSPGSTYITGKCLTIDGGSFIGF